MGERKDNGENFNLSNPFYTPSISPPPPPSQKERLMVLTISYRLSGTMHITVRERSTTGTTGAKKNHFQDEMCVLSNRCVCLLRLGVLAYPEGPFSRNIDFFFYDEYFQIFKFIDGIFSVDRPARIRLPHHSHEIEKQATAERADFAAEMRGCRLCLKKCRTMVLVSPLSRRFFALIATFLSSTL